MRDTLGRDISYLRLSVTDKCNCRCVYCMPAAGVPARAHRDLLTFARAVERGAASADGSPALAVAPDFAGKGGELA